MKHKDNDNDPRMGRRLWNNGDFPEFLGISP